jgi:hypothetical protein
MYVNVNSFVLVHSFSTTKSSPPSSISSHTRRPSGQFQIKLLNPPPGRRPMNGTNTSNNPSQSFCKSDFYLPPSKSSSINDKSQTFEQPPPIPPRSSLLNTTNKRGEGQFVRPGETPIKAKRTIFRSRNVKRREPTTTAISKNTRSDSADALSVQSSRYHQNSVRRRQLQVEKETNSD